ncbi:MAG: ACP S-malonyltransferase [Anaerovoracaceae bacterium]
MKISIVFAGQGAQHEGMGKELYDNYPVAKKIFDDAGEDIKNWCFNGSKEELRQTQITQPTIYTVTMACYETFLDELSKKPELLKKLDIIAFGGFSLGEYAALTAAGSISSIQQGVRIVRQRGQMMMEAGLGEDGQPKGGMVAAFGDRAAVIKAVEETKAKFPEKIIQCANFNSPIQTVVAGDSDVLEDFIEIAKNHKIKGKLLSVSTAFHTAMMEPAAEKLDIFLEDEHLKKPSLACYSNIDAMDVMAEITELKPEEGESEKETAEAISKYIADRMAKQTKSPVFWQEIIEKMIASGVEVVIEIGPGKTLSGITKKISHDVVTLHIENPESLHHTIETLESL